MIKSVTIVPD